MEAARESNKAARSNLAATMASEDRALAGMAEWSPPSESRPNSGWKNPLNGKILKQVKILHNKDNAQDCIFGSRSGREKAEKEKSEKEMNEAEDANGEGYMTVIPVADDDATWAELMEIEASDATSFHSHFCAITDSIA